MNLIFFIALNEFQIEIRKIFEIYLFEQLFYLFITYPSSGLIIMQIHHGSGF